MVNNPFAVIGRDINNQYFWQADYPEDVQVNLVWCDEGTMSVRIPPLSAVYALLPATYGIAVTYNGVAIASGPIDKTTYHYNEKIPVDPSDIQCNDYLRILRDRIVLPSTYTGTLPGSLTFSAASDDFSGTSEAALIHYVNACIGTTAQTSRQKIGFSTATSLGRGAAVTLKVRMKTLQQVLQAITYADPLMGFTVVENTDGTLVFTPQVVRDMTASVVFTAGLGNVISSEYTEERPIANRIYVLGSGTTTSRAVYAVEDSASIARWGLIENIYNYSNTGDASTLQTQATAYLNQSAHIYDLKLTVLDTQGLQYGRDYTLGDMVTAFVPELGIAVTQLIREIHFTWNSNEGDRVAPVLATPAKRHNLRKSKKGFITIDDRVLNMEGQA